ncbi:MAG: tetratricopeptide repeat-containing sensor histidine kinase [Bacteroidia bacterium]
MNNTDPDSVTLEKYLSRANDMGGDDIAAVKLICNWVHGKSEEKHLPNVQARALYSIGRIYLITDDFEEATKYFNQALKLALQYKMLTTQANCYGGFANIFSANKQYVEAKKNYDLAIDLYLRTKDSANVASISFNLGALIAEAKPDSNYFAESIRYINIALSMATEKSNPDVYIYAIGMKGYLYSNAGLFDSVNYFLSEAQRVIEERNFDEYRPQIFFNGGFHLLNLKQYDKAIEYFEKGIEIALKQNSQFWLANFYECLSLSYTAKGNHERALFYYKKHKEVYDSFVNEENFSKVVDLRHLYENEKKEKEMAEAKKAKAIVDLQLDIETQKKRNLIILLFGVVAVAALFLMLVVRLRKNIRERKIAYTKLEEKNNEIQNQARKLIQQSKEIARYQSQMNPHFVFNALNSIQGHVMNDEKERSINQLQHFSKLMRQTLNNSDNELISLHTEFDFLLLYFSFEKERFQQKIEFEISSETDNKNVMIPPMMIQPFIENALKHAGLDQTLNPRIHLRVEEDNDQLLIKILDNGLGLKTVITPTPNAPHATEIVRSRIRLLFENLKRAAPENLLEIRPAIAIPSGTEVCLHLPLINRF